MKVPLRVRVAGLVLGLLAAFGIIGVSLDRGHANQTRLILDQERQDLTRQLENTILLFGRTLTAYAQDYSYWDETVEFLTTRDPEWEEINLTGSFTTYHANADWALNRRFEVCHAETNIPDTVLEAPPIDPGTLASALLADPDLHCFARVRTGLLEIQAAPIQRQSPTGRTTPIDGYFVVGRLWDGAMFADLGTSLDAQVTLVPAGSRSTDLGAEEHGDRIELRYPLKDASGVTIAELCAIRNVPFAAELEEAARRTRMTLAMVVPALLLLFFANFWWWVNRPLDDLSECVRDRDALRLAEWAARDDEFGNLAREIEPLLSSPAQARPKEWPPGNEGRDVA